MKNVLKLIFSSLLVFPFTMNAQQQDFPAGTTPNEHNINGADYPRIGEDVCTSEYTLPTPRK